MQDADVVRIQVETLGEQRAQFTVGARVRQGLPQLDYTAPLVAGEVLRLAAVGHEVCVVLGSHGQKVSSPVWGASVRCSTEPWISVKVIAT